MDVLDVQHMEKYSGIFLVLEFVKNWIFIFLDDLKKTLEVAVFIRATKKKSSEEIQFKNHNLTHFLSFSNFNSTRTL